MKAADKMHGLLVKCLALLTAGPSYFRVSAKRRILFLCMYADGRFSLDGTQNTKINAERIIEAHSVSAESYTRKDPGHMIHPELSRRCFLSRSTVR